MATGADLDFHHDIVDIAFSNILQEFPDISEEDKQKLMNAFESLSYYYKDTLLVRLENRGDYKRFNDKFKKIEFIRSFLFDDVDDTKERTKKFVTLNDDESSLLQQEVIAPIIHKTAKKKKDYMALTELENLIGLDRVKLEVRKLLALTEMSKRRKQYNLSSPLQSFHMIFKGNPGTGKTTVARLLGEILHEVGVLSSGHVIELDRSQLISKYQGEIEQRIVQYVEQAKGGILFIDEIYSLHQEKDSNDQGKHGIEVLLKVMEDKRHDFIFIGAGYTSNVNEFLKSNPGLVSRFPIHIDFEDYTVEQLLDIAVSMLEERDYVMDDTFKELLAKNLQEEMNRDNFANARVVRNIVESAIREQSLRLYNSGKETGLEELMTIISEDFKYESVKL